MTTCAVLDCFGAHVFAQPSASQDIKRCLGNDDLADFLESMGISTDDVWTGLYGFQKQKH